jgi:hypothetical protein
VAAGRHGHSWYFEAFTEVNSTQHNSGVAASFNQTAYTPDDGQLV